MVALISLGAFLSGIGLMVGCRSGNRRSSANPGDSLSRVSSYDWFGSFAFYPVGLAIWGPISAAIGIHTSLWLAFAFFIVAIMVLVAIPDVRRLAAVPDKVATEERPGVGVSLPARPEGDAS